MVGDSALVRQILLSWRDKVCYSIWAECWKIAAKAALLWENTGRVKVVTMPHMSTSKKRDGEVSTDAKIRSALRVQRRWLQFSDEEWDKELESFGR